MKWQWKDWPPAGKTQVCDYKVPEDAQEGFDREIQSWQEAGYLVPWEEQRHGAIKNILPLMCVQQQKGATTKVRPVLDFRWLNEHVLSHPGAAMPLCQDRLREWCQ